MKDLDEKLPIRPSSDPQVLGVQLEQSLIIESPPIEMTRHKGYLAQIIKDCILAIKAGDLDAARKALDIMAPALHRVERIHYLEPEVALEVWTVQWVLDVAAEALMEDFYVVR